MVSLDQFEREWAKTYPLFSHMLDLIEDGRVNAILCWKINRLARKMEEGGKLAQLLIDGKLREIRTVFGTFRTGDSVTIDPELCDIAMENIIRKLEEGAASAGAV